MENYFQPNVQLLELVCLENIVNGSKIIFFW